MRRQLQLYGSQTLSRKSEDLDLIEYKELLTDLLEDMRYIMEEEEGLGLSAPQAGENVRLFILDSTHLPSITSHSTFINPVIVSTGENVKNEEGCLSLPGIFEKITRYSSVEITALDKNGKEFSLKLDNLAARAVQHEIDHLEGILIIDRISSIRRRFLRPKLVEINETARKLGQV